MSLKPGIAHATAAGAAETLGGAGVLLGYRTPLASAGLVSVMLTAINRVHLRNGPWVPQGGYEYPVVMAAAAVSLAESGPGALSLDALRGKEKSGAKWGLLSLALGTAGAAGAHFLAESRAKPDAVAAEATAAASVNGADPVVAPADAASAAAASSSAAAEQAAAEQAAQQAAAPGEPGGEVPPTES